MASLLLLLLALCLSSGQAYAARPTATFVFGDSLVDVGMNNNLVTLAKANHKPNGIDYPGQKATGRFCNGRLVSDFLAEHWGLEPALAYTDPEMKGQKLLYGANFASAGAGILDDTGNIFLQRFRMNQQIRLFRDYIGNLSALVGASAAAQVVAGGAYSVTIGANDFLANYYLPISPRKAQSSVPEFIQLLMTRLKEQLKEIYALGARKVVVSGIGPVGCIPLVIGQRFATDKGKCISVYQDAASSFNDKLVLLIQELGPELPDATLLYSNAFNLVSDLINNPSLYGFESVNSACCGVGPNRGLLPCMARDKLCSNRGAYLFWDAFHPTEATNRIVTQKILDGPPSLISPININQLFPLP